METLFANLVIFLVIIFLISWIFVALGVYFLPTIIAFVRKHNNIWAVSILNIVLGWTFLGWLASLLWALNSDVKKED